MAIDGGIVPEMWFDESFSTARLTRYWSSVGIGPVSELLERSSDWRLVQLEMKGEMEP
ncbi:hypothetical protein HanIR_Chr14g0705341 [Helianthus annuus]|nr:hypothetical protein HanIR_Chr14g0705341 [Helianthus annuus]